MALLNFDASTVAPNEGSLGAIPAGWYNAAIVESEMKPAKANPEHAYLQLTFQVLDGRYVGRKIYVRLNLINSNEQTRSIAYADLSAIGHSVGVIKIADSEMLHNIPLKVRAKVNPAQGDYEASNDIRAYKNINEVVDMADAGGIAPGPGAAPMAPTAAPPPVSAPAPTAAPPEAGGVPGGQPWPQPGAGAAPAPVPGAAPAPLAPMPGAPVPGAMPGAAPVPAAVPVPGAVPAAGVAGQQPPPWTGATQ